MFCRLKKKIIYPAHVSKNSGKHVILMILNGEELSHIRIKNYLHY